MNANADENTVHPSAPSVPVGNPFSNAKAVVVSETASSTALVQREVADVQASILAAQRFPRDPVQATERVLTACARPTLAAEALYQYARGGTDIEGPSIRLVEAIAQQWGRIQSGVVELERSGGYSEVLTYAIDLESLYRDEKRFKVKHWRDTKSGGYQARDERDIYEIIANQGARRKRACLLAVIPADVVDAAIEQCKETLRTTVKITPERIASLAKKFSEEFSVTKEQIEKRLQRRLDTITPAQMVQLSKLYNSLRDGMSVASDWFDIPTSAPAEPTVGIEGAKAALKARKRKATEQNAAAKADPFDGNKPATDEPPLAWTPDEPRPIADERAVPPAEWVPPEAE